MPKTMPYIIGLSRASAFDGSDVVQSISESSLMRKIVALSRVLFDMSYISCYADLYMYICKA